MGSGLIAVGSAIWWLKSRKYIPEKAAPVKNFDVKLYLGNWYEIARLDNRFEQNIDNALAQYYLKDDGTVKVINSGYNHKKEKWASVHGVAKFRNDKHTAALKVSFFRPFYAGYNVIALDKDYQYALVAGKNLAYLWILSRTKTIPNGIKASYLEIAKAIGYDIVKLVWVKQNKSNPYAQQKLQNMNKNMDRRPLAIKN